MLLPMACSSHWSRSMNGTPARSASRWPTVDLPAPGMPTSAQRICMGVLPLVACGDAECKAVGARAGASETWRRVMGWINGLDEWAGCMQGCAGATGSRPGRRRECAPARIARSFLPPVFAPSSRRPRHGAHRPVTPPTPAIVTQQAVSPLPRWALLLLCSAYVVPGFVGREPWKSADITAFGYMLALARGQTPWFGPLLGGMPPESESLLPYWLGARALQLGPLWLSAELAARIPFAALLVVTLLATWYGTYYLARSPGAQPVAFAFGGEANPPDYARAMADGALLALIACLGLAQLSHEMSSHLVQLGCVALLFFALAAMPHRRWASALALVLGMFGLTLSGAPALAALLGVGSMVLVLHAPGDQSGRRLRWVLALAAVTLAAALLAWGLHCWRWRIVSADAVGKEWQSLARLLLWFGWPAWPLALWTVWRWRRQILSRQGHRHLLLPLWFCALSLAAASTTRPADRALLPGLPALGAPAGL